MKFLDVIAVIVGVLGIILAISTAVLLILNSCGLLDPNIHYQNPPRAQIYGGEYVLFS